VVLADDVESDSIVLLGHFNPGLIQPNWLETQGLFEGREIKVGDAIVTPPVTTLNLGWLVVEVLEQRASFTTTEEATSAGLLRDFVVDLFRILEHTPVSAIGMNQFQHFGLPDGAWDRLIAKLGPSDLLQDALPGAATKSLRWDAPREDGLAGHRALTLEPSVRLAGGAWVSWNSHVDLGADKRGSDAVAVLEQRWDHDRRTATSMADFLRGLAP
jgi:hypothetical protein